MEGAYLARAAAVDRVIPTAAYIARVDILPLWTGLSLRPEQSNEVTNGLVEAIET